MTYFFCFFLLWADTGTQTLTHTPLEQGFNAMYNLEFSAAHQAFQNWERQHPEDPEAPVFDAAAYLFSEFDRLRILQSQFFVNDQGYTSLQRQSPSPEIRQKFEAALGQGANLAAARLKQAPDDEGALFANVLRLGLHSNYLALIQKNNFAALAEVKQSTLLAEQLIQRYPDNYDAYIAIGIENYLLSLKPAPVRWLLHATGAQTDKQFGIEKLRLTATKGHYLKPYAQLLLAVAALRDKNNEEARNYLSGLAARFPDNPLYREELAKIK